MLLCSSSISPRFACMCLLALGSSLLSGCGGSDRPPLGLVSGKVTVDGEPLGGAIVTFLPERGRPAVATTDSQGAYEIQYLQGVSGCKVGKNKIMFAVPTGGSTSKAIPAKYQNTSDLEVEVKSGKNNFDFDLKSDPSAKKPQPKPGTRPID